MFGGGLGGAAFGGNTMLGASFESFPLSVHSLCLVLGTGDVPF